MKENCIGLDWSEVCGYKYNNASIQRSRKSRCQGKCRALAMTTAAD